MKKKIFSILLSLCMVLTMIPVATGTVWAEGETPIENVTFGYAYDVQRSKAYPKKGEDVTLSNLANPIVTSGDIEHRGTSDGEWTLTKAGTYAYMVASKKATDNLTKLVQKLISGYSSSDGTVKAEKIIVHELKNNGTPIAYGVIVAYGSNAESGERYALFQGDTLSGSGAGYFITTSEATNSSYTVKASELFTEKLQSRSINLELPDGSSFKPKEVGYNEDGVETKTVKVINTGTEATGDLVVNLSGADAGCFEILPTESTISSITKVGGAETFSIKPKIGLQPGTYTATLAVSGTGIEAQSVDISFKVNPIVPQGSIKLSEEGTYTFPEATVGYSDLAAKEVKITSTETAATGELVIDLSGTNKDSFTLSKTKIESIAEGGSATFTVTPNANLAAGSYTAKVTVSGDNIASQSFNVSFTVNPKVSQRSIELSEEGSYTFPTATVGYSDLATKEVKITSTGTAATGELVIDLSGTNEDSFKLNKTKIESIAVGESDTFTVTPKTGLEAGTYTAKVTVSDGNLIFGSFDVSFTVNKASSGGGSHSSSIQKPTIIAGEGAETSLSILGTNLTIKVTEGYELTDVILNGVSKGKVTELTGLRTGDKVEVKTEKKQEKPTKEEIIAALDSSKLVARSKLITLENGKKAVRVTWYDQNGNEIDFDGIEVYRSVKRYKGYGLEPFYTTKGDKSEGYYVNTKDLKEGTTYYYKVRGYVTIDGQKYYTDYSLKAIRTIK